MDGISNAASVIAVIQVAGSIVKICGGYIAEVKGARQDIEQVQREVESLTSILQKLSDLLQSQQNGTELSTSGVLRDNMTDCLRILEDLKAKIEPKQKQPVMKRLGLRALKWPLKRDDVMKVVDRLERIKSSISLGLDIDQMAMLNLLGKSPSFPELTIAEGAAFDSYLNQHVGECLQGTRTDLLRQISDWAVSPQGKSIFWLRGMAGTGKSTIARTVAGAWKNGGQLGASFFFKRGEADCGNASKFFSTIAQQLMVAHPGLHKGIRKAVEDEPQIASKSLSEQFKKLLLQPILATVDHNQPRKTILVIDALDECDGEEDVQALLRLLPQLQKSGLRIFITSRPELPIRLGFQQFSNSNHRQEFALHDIPTDTISHDISIFLKDRLASIQQQFSLRGRQLPPSWPSEDNIKAMTAMSVPLFIFAATACRLLEDDQWNPVDTLDEILAHQSDTSTLDGTYLPVLNRLLLKQGPQAKKAKLIEEYKNVIGFIILLENPLSVVSLSRLIGIPKENVHTRLDSLHSVFSIPAHESDDPVRPFHLSFRDFLVDTETKEKTPFWVDEIKIHQKIANRCLDILGQMLQKDFCRLSYHGIKRVDIPSDVIKKYLTEDVQYACRYWVDHTCKTQPQLDQSESVFEFLTAHYTHWLEAMSILGLVSEVVNNIDKLIVYIKTQTGDDHLWSFLHDARLFIWRNIQTFDLAPLQIYSAGLVFAPSGSIVKKTLSKEIPPWLKLLSNGDESWTACLQTLEGHNNSIDTLSYSPNGSLLVSHSQDGTARLWDADTGICQQIIEEDFGTFSPVVFTQSGSILIASWIIHDVTVRIWDISTGICLQTLKIDTSGLEHCASWDGVRKVSLSPDGRALASVIGESAIQMWDTYTGTCQNTVEDHTGVIHDLSFSSNGRYLATASEDHSIQLYEISTNCSARHKYIFVGHSSAVSNLFFSPNNKILASASTDCTVRLWNISTGRCQHLLNGHIDFIADFAFSPDGQMLASSSCQGPVRLWDTSTGSCLHVLNDDKDGAQVVTFSPNGGILAIASHSTIRFWSTRTSSFSPQVLKVRGPLKGAVAFSPDRQTLASASDDNIVRIWDMTTTHVEQTVEYHQDRVCVIAFSSNGKLVASSSLDCTVRLWDANTCNCEQTLVGHKHAVDAIAFTPDDCILATGSGDKTVRLWDTKTGACRYILEGQAGGITAVQVSPTNRMLASASSWDRFVRVWNIDTGTCQFILDCHAGIRTVAFSSDGTTLASACWRRIEDFGVNGKHAADKDHTIHIWDISTGTRKILVESLIAVAAMSISPDGHKLVSVSYDRYVQIWDMRTGVCEDTIENALAEYPLTNPLLTLFPDYYPQAPNHPLSVTKQWISCGQKDLIRLPPDNRPTTAAVFDRKVVLGHESGLLTFMEFPITTPDNLEPY